MENQTLVKEICPTTTQDWVKRGALLERHQLRRSCLKY